MAKNAGSLKNIAESVILTKKLSIQPLLKSVFQNVFQIQCVTWPHGIQLLRELFLMNLMRSVSCIRLVPQIVNLVVVN